jgi:predicted RNase H-like HicB family nuclease
MNFPSIRRLYLQYRKNIVHDLGVQEPLVSGSGSSVIEYRCGFGDERGGFRIRGMQHSGAGYKTRSLRGIRSDLKKPIIPVSHTIIITKPDRSYLSMKTLIEVHREGKYFVAVDLLTNVADQGLSEDEAVQNLKKGLEEHFQLLIELTPRNHKLTYLDIEVDNLVKKSSAVSS